VETIATVVDELCRKGLEQCRQIVVVDHHVCVAVGDSPVPARAVVHDFFGRDRIVFVTATEGKRE
jgi:hypothetical protein